MLIAHTRKITKVTRMDVTQDKMRKITGSNLARLRKGKKLTLEQLAEQANTNATYLSAIESGKKGLGPGLLIRLCNALKVDASEFTRPLDDFKPAPPPSGKIAVISMGKGGPEGYYEAPYPVGHGFDYIDRPYDVSDENAYAVKVVGDSMSPRYEEGEIVVASPQKEVHTGDYVVAKLSTGEVMIKKIKFREGLVILSSVNPSVEAWICKPREIVFYHKVVWKKEKG
ncbi:MAG: hypothetical protein FD174_2615 [Geobacteraceae bacterium]|nr:MAG: hypothetical protein FD174_2615 [Geobacteraceae bacterium]